MTEKDRKELWRSILQGARDAVLDRLNPSDPLVVVDEWDSETGSWKGPEVVELCAKADAMIASHIVGKLMREGPPKT